jgi:hypothetical protein
MDGANYGPYLLWGLAIVVLGLVIFLFGDRLRPLKRGERQRSEEAARRNWGKEETR